MATVSITREIIDDFRTAIEEKATKGNKPGKRIINFRKEKTEKIEREIVEVPLELLRFRKDNGRIGVEVSSYERKFGIFTEKDEKTQEMLFEWLKTKDKNRTEKLYNLIRKDGQGEPAVATCDGFLIDGNRRLMVLRQLREDEGGDEFTRMRVVLLPGKGDAGGAPTVEEIEKLENTYQLQDDGKSEYTHFAKALSYRRKHRNGYALERQIADDPQFYRRKDAIPSQVKVVQTEFLKPLKIIDRYLESFEIDGQYDHAESRWEAFLEYSKFFHVNLTNPSKKHALTGISDDQIDEFEFGIFSIIRSQAVAALTTGKLHLYMRKLRNYCKSDDYVEEIAQLGTRIIELEPVEDDDEWVTQPLGSGTLIQEVYHKVRRANDFAETKAKGDSPLQLLQDAGKKLNHKNLKIQNVVPEDLKKVSVLADSLIDRLETLKEAIYKRNKE